ncbi:Vitamin B12-binding protein [Pleomorphomonas sp. T1.2MG-36]|uniref:ABC transporter substrate-binding protein n=1 Tax=Pleomorphomonas sp. T1.2MG-36 TaxID=3041167 RepID=UPI0024779C56|nr:ABC transporter substrate-binding protein [Pleomorphomonas sp. T1.2MG-36]CAI9409354.1 Vitamin B12-binding protein [Pleomorphomonas sp. T1.2MG-36]
MNEPTTSERSPKRQRRHLAACAVLGALVAALTESGQAADGAPGRVVSINLCTDQQAMAIAAPGQLASVSRLARDPALSNMADAAAALPVNDGRAEEVVSLAPDLVLAGSFTSRATVGMLRRLGVRVEEFPPANSFDDIRENLTRMGQLLGRTERADELVREFDARLAALESDASESAQKPVAVVYHIGNGTDGRGTLADEILTAAGWDNLAARLGLGSYGALPLETLVAGRPDLVLVGGAEASWSTEALPNARHPAIMAATDNGDRLMVLPDRSTICGTPFVVDAIARLVDERHRQATHRRPAP